MFLFTGSPPQDKTDEIHLPSFQIPHPTQCLSFLSFQELCRNTKISMLPLLTALSPGEFYEFLLTRGSCSTSSLSSRSFPCSTFLYYSTIQPSPQLHSNPSLLLNATSILSIPSNCWNSSIIRKWPPRYANCTFIPFCPPNPFHFSLFYHPFLGSLSILSSLQSNSKPLP